MIDKNNLIILFTHKLHTSIKLFYIDKVLICVIVI